MDPFIQSKLFRFRENERKIGFLQQQGISFDTIRKACAYSLQNNFHSFGHELGVAEQAIKIAIEEGRSDDEKKILGLVGLFHDAGHTGIQYVDDEIMAFKLAKGAITEIDTKGITQGYDQIISHIRDGIIATIFGQRGKIDDPLSKIIQDADLAHLGLGWKYQLWASMGLIDERNAGFIKAGKNVISPEDFIKIDQEKFIKSLGSIPGVKNGVRLSQGAIEIFQNPFEYIPTLKSLSSEAIDYAYSVRHEDILLEEFKDGIQKYVSV